MCTAYQSARRYCKLPLLPYSLHQMGLLRSLVWNEVFFNHPRLDILRFLFFPHICQNRSFLSDFRYFFIHLHLWHLFRMSVSIKQWYLLTLKLIDFWWEKLSILLLLPSVFPRYQESPFRQEVLDYRCGIR